SREYSARCLSEKCRGLIRVGKRRPEEVIDVGIWTEIAADLCNFAWDGRRDIKFEFLVRLLVGFECDLRAIRRPGKLANVPTGDECAANALRFAAAWGHGE